LFARYIHAREHRHAGRDTNRLVRPFAWGTEFIEEHVNGEDPRVLFRDYARNAISDSAAFFTRPSVEDYSLVDGRLTWTSSIHTPSPENNLVRARFFPAPQRPGRPSKSVLILPHWNADPNSYIALCHLFNRLGFSALRLTLPYHEDRKPPEIERSDYLVCSNIGRTLQSMRQAVVDTRAAVDWLKNEQGFDRIGLVGTSIGSCTGFLAAAHDPRIDVGVFNHVSGYFADVVWHGISTQHVKRGIGESVSLEDLRQYWLPISPYPFIARVAQMKPRPMRFIAARYDLTFPADLSRQVIAEARRRNLPVDVSWLPCGHYTSGDKPWVYLVGGKIVNYIRKRL
jgi:dienelactone hydrolase